MASHAQLEMLGRKDSLLEAPPLVAPAGRLPPISGAVPAAPFARQPVPWEKEGLEHIKIQSILKNLRHELASCQRQREVEIRTKDAQIADLRRLLEMQREEGEKQKAEIKSLHRSLKDYQVSDGHQQRALAKTANNSDVIIRSLRNKISNAEVTHARAMSMAAEALDSARRERMACALGLAAISFQAVSGLCGYGAESALAEGSEPLPRHAGIWTQLHFTLDDKGNLAAHSRNPGSYLRPFDRDGARAVAALAAQVARLHRQRALYRQRAYESVEQLKRLQGLLDSIDMDFTVVNMLVDVVANEAEQVAAACGLPPLLSKDSTEMPAGKISERLGVMYQLLTALAAEVLLADRERHSQRAYLAAMCPGADLQDESTSPASGQARLRQRQEALQGYQQQVLDAVGQPVLGSYSSMLARVHAACQAAQAVEAASIRGLQKGLSSGGARSTSPHSYRVSRSTLRTSGANTPARQSPSPQRSWASVGSSGKIGPAADTQARPRPDQLA
ncbi:flagellar associated protein, partial [Haematococcus lacustris]